jgi:hypothetical protein
VSGSFIRMPALIYVLGFPPSFPSARTFELPLTSLRHPDAQPEGNEPALVILLIAGTIGSQARLQRKLPPRLQLVLPG